MEQSEGLEWLSPEIQNAPERGSNTDCPEQNVSLLPRAGKGTQGKSSWDLPPLPDPGKSRGPKLLWEHGNVPAGSGAPALFGSSLA